MYTLRDGRIDRAPVKLGTQPDGNAYVEVREGLAAGDRVIVAALADAKVGQKAVVREAPSGARNQLTSRR